jgi:hypothetical protein
MIYILNTQEQYYGKVMFVEYKNVIIFTHFYYNPEIFIIDLTHMESSREYTYFMLSNKNSIIPMLETYIKKNKNTVFLTKTNTTFLQEILNYYSITPLTQFKSLKCISNYSRRINALIFCENIKNLKNIKGDVFFNLQRNIIEFL